MSIDFLPQSFTRATALNIVVPVVGEVPDLTDPSNGRVVIPTRVELYFRRDEGTPRGLREYVHVAVVGPRRLKSGDAGRPITSIGWERAGVEGRTGVVARPDWLTDLIVDEIPEGWDPSLVEPGAVR